ncbi:MAG: methionine aminotransferase [Bacteroidetes bacterium RIFCSPLOWO2_12_FULL_31_6]|nr:MAG: methionine aminotransferase [Bacteroidetes bacterium RIFCSPLOWO2_12_FULL_31_6]
MSQLATEYKAVNLSQGFPDFEISKKLIELVNHYMKSGMNQYAPMPGVMALREAISKKVEDEYGKNYNPDTEITITAGGTQALYTAISALVREGDEVVVFEPYYDSYVPSIELNGGRPIFVTLKAPDYKIDWERVKKIINQRTRMIIINTPHNPTSTIWSKADMEMLEKITKDSDIIILSDEVYEHIIFDGKQHESVIRYPKLAERSLVVFSFGKTFHATGWKTGYCMAPDYLMKEFRKSHQFMVFSTNTPIQYALADFLKDKSNYTGIGEFYQKKRDYFLEIIQQTKFKPLPVNGSYFQLVKYDHLSDEKDTDYAIRLTKEFGIATIPVSVFYHKPVDNKVLRLCFAKSKETLDKAAEKLCKI